MIDPAALLRNSRPYTWCVIAIAIAWSVGMLVSWGLLQSGVAVIDGPLLTLVGIGSGLVAFVGGLPGMVLELLPDSGESPGRITIGFSVGVLIRLVGTVALVVMCSYHLPAARKEIAGMILAWYVYLTTVDVALLAMLLPRQNRPAASRR